LRDSPSRFELLRHSSFHLLHFGFMHEPIIDMQSDHHFMGDASRYSMSSNRFLTVQIASGMVPP